MKFHGLGGFLFSPVTDTRNQDCAPEVGGVFRQVFDGDLGKLHHRIFLSGETKAKDKQTKEKGTNK